MSQTRRRPPGKNTPKNRASQANRAAGPSATPPATPPAAPAARPKAQPTITTPERVSAVERRAQRAAEAQQAQRQRQLRTLLIGLAVAVVVAIVATLFIRQKLAEQSLGTFVPNEGQTHVNDGTTLTFNHYPPSSGTHYPSAQPAGIYRTQSVNEGNWVHSLEHGYVVALVRCTDNCGPIFDQLQAIYDNNLKNSKWGSKKFLALRYDKPFTNGHTPPVTMVAWNYELELDGVNQDTVVAFYNKFVDKGPEDVP